MFGKSKKPHLIEVSKLSSLIAEDVEITGDIVFGSGLRIDGTLKGNAMGKDGDSKKEKSLLVLSDKGRIEGSVRCYDAVINGTVIGDLEVEHFLELQPKARVSGTIRYHKLQMEVGAGVQGTITQVGGDALRDNVVELPAEKSDKGDKAERARSA
ncbi:polymer-forming cytoskeletal protein [Niveibacterium sp.]|uniref:bactofilin family protein n=1 Tax=Niveibacterium sp. TaxID=2017444 RepID=UPI0035B40703